MVWVQVGSGFGFTACCSCLGLTDFGCRGWGFEGLGVFRLYGSIFVRVFSGLDKGCEQSLFWRGRPGFIDFEPPRIVELENPNPKYTICILEPIPIL